jgi:hypothetical protein
MVGRMIPPAVIGAVDPKWNMYEVLVRNLD